MKCVSKMESIAEMAVHAQMKNHMEIIEKYEEFV